MADIVERLRDSDTTRRIGESYADVHDRRQADRDEAADKITRLTAERDALTAENAAHNHAAVKYLVQIDELRAENEKLRAALEPLACTCDRPNGAACSRSEVDCPFWSARAALTQEKRDE